MYYVALGELYVHQALRRLEPDVRYEEGGQGPVFRVYRDGRQVLAVEVLSLFLQPEWARQARRHGELTDRLNKTFRPQIPRHWMFVDEFPMTVTGKVQKFKMREASIAELGLQGAADTRTA